MTSLIALLSACAFILGIVAGVLATMAVVEHYVRTDGNFTYKWNKRWYRVQGHRR